MNVIIVLSENGRQFPVHNTRFTFSSDNEKLYNISRKIQPCQYFHRSLQSFRFCQAVYTRSWRFFSSPGPLSITTMEDWPLSGSGPFITNRNRPTNACKHAIKTKSIYRTPAVAWPRTTRDFSFVWLSIRSFAHPIVPHQLWVWLCAPCNRQLLRSNPSKDEAEAVCVHISALFVLKTHVESSLMGVSTIYSFHSANLFLDPGSRPIQWQGTSNQRRSTAWYGFAFG